MYIIKNLINNLILKSNNLISTIDEIVNLNSLNNLLDLNLDFRFIIYK